LLKTPCFDIKHGSVEPQVGCARQSIAQDIKIMSRVCQVTGKRPKVGNTVSHANNRKRRRFLPNLHTHRFWLEGEKRFVSLRITTRGLRTIEKRGVEVVVADLRAQGVKV
jgi:large subunit ribosomal protein L28